VRSSGVGSSLSSLSGASGLNLRGGEDSSGSNIPLSGGAAARGRESSIGTVSDGYRSEATQRALRNAPHRPDYVARGTSHHTMGDAADLGGDEASKRWARDHASEYGLRFPMNNPRARVYEPWHVQSNPNTKVPVPQAAASEALAKAHAAHGHSVRHGGTHIGPTSFHINSTRGQSAEQIGAVVEEKMNKHHARIARGHRLALTDSLRLDRCAPLRMTATDIGALLSHVTPNYLLAAQFDCHG
jgi:hypothetical protein